MSNSKLVEPCDTVAGKWDMISDLCDPECTKKYDQVVRMVPYYRNLLRSFTERYHACIVDPYEPFSKGWCNFS